MARDDDADWITPGCCARGARVPRTAGAARKLAVGDGFAETHRGDCLPHGPLKGRAFGRERNLEALALAVAEGRLVLMPNADIEATLDGLRALPGVGEWTAQYIAMRVLSWPDAFPHTDLGVMKALGETDAQRVRAAGEAWRPWRAYAVMHLWQSLTRE